MCFAVALVFCGIQPSRAVDGLAVVAGEGRRSDMLRIGAQWQWSGRWLQGEHAGEHAHLGGFWVSGTSVLRSGGVKRRPASMTASLKSA